MNYKSRASLIGLIPVVIGACSGEIDGTVMDGPEVPPFGSADPTGTGTPTGSNTNGSPTTTAVPGATNPPGSTTTGGSATSNGTTTGPDGTTSVSTPGTTGSSVDGSDNPPQTGALPLSLAGEPIYAHAVRLTHDQWEHSVRDLLKLEAPTGEREGLTDDAVGVHDFSNNELNLEVGPKLWADYQGAAEALAAQVAGSEAALGRIYSGTDSSGFISSFGLRAFRRPLSEQEAADYQAVYDTGAALSEGGATPFARGAGLVIEAMLQSPHFLYRTELQAAGVRLSGYEVAAKLSLLLRGTTPSDELLASAGRGELDSDDAVSSLATQMLDDSDAVQVMRTYHDGILSFNRFDNIQKSVDAVPDFDAALNADLKESAFRFFDRIFSNSLGVREMLTTQTAFATPAMGKLYGIELQGSEMQEVTLDAARPGYFTQLPFLIVNSVNLVPDSIHRGVSLNHQVLCAEVPPPTAANVALPARQEGQSNRELVEAGTGTGTCGAACHGTYINPLGFAFENFDGMGQLRDSDAGKPVNTSATYPFTEGNVEFSGAAGLMQEMAERSQAHTCYAKHLAGFFLQRDLVAADQPMVDSLAQASANSDASIKELLLSLVTSPAFTTRPSGEAE